MMFRSAMVDAQWDTWCYYHEGTYYLYYLITESSHGEGFGVASSTDGLHWEDHGPAVLASDEMVEYLGTGAVWKSADFDTTGRFICNYSEWRRHLRQAQCRRPEQVEGRREGERKTQNILFAWSTDLVRWSKFGDESMFSVDERWYEKHGRWDCIFPMPRAEGRRSGSVEGSACPNGRGGYYGTWTATPKGRKGVGLGYSEDGLRWHVLEPPEVDPGVCEAGAFHRFGDKVHAMFGAGGAMWSYVADDVTGPYRRAGRNALLLSKGHTYFSRFFQAPGGVLVNHHSMSGERLAGSGRAVTYAAPFKLAVVDSEGVLRMKYWDGNDALKGEAVEVGPDADSGIVTMVTPGLDFSEGIVAEGTLRLAGKGDGEPVGLYIEVDDRRYAVRVDGDGRAAMGPIDPSGELRKVEQRADRERRFGPTVGFRLLARRGMLELYLDDHFMECYTMGCPEGRRVRIGVVGDRADGPVRLSAGSQAGDLEVWQMR